MSLATFSLRVLRNASLTLISWLVAGCAHADPKMIGGMTGVV